MPGNKTRLWDFNRLRLHDFLLKFQNKGVYYKTCYLGRKGLYPCRTKDIRQLTAKKIRIGRSIKIGNPY